MSDFDPKISEWPSDKSWSETYLTKDVIIPLILFGVVLGFIGFEFIWPAIQDYTAFWKVPPGYINANPIKQPTQMAPFSFRGTHGVFYTHSYHYIITPVADYDITARVLHTRHYYSDANAADLIPFDMGLGWGIMSDPYALKNYFAFHHSNQGGRLLWIKLRGNQDDIPLEYQQEPATGSHFSNNHLIPADDDVYYRLNHMRTGDLVHLKGYLVDLRSADKPHWIWTTTKYDRGDPGKNYYWGDAGEPTCDTFFVTSAETI